MFQETCHRHCTSLNVGKELVQEQSSGAYQGSHEGVLWYASIECGKTLRQPAPHCDSSNHPVSSLFRATAASRHSCLGVLKNTTASFFWSQSLQPPPGKESLPSVLLIRYRSQSCRDPGHRLYAIPATQIILYDDPLPENTLRFEHSTLGEPWPWISLGMVLPSLATKYIDVFS